MLEHNFEIIETPTQPVLSIRKVTTNKDLLDELAKAYGMIMAYLNEIGEQPGAAAFAAYHNMDMQNWDVEIGFPLAHPVPGRGEMQPGEIPAGRKGSCMYKGPYQKMGPTYAALTKWLAEQGEEPTGVSYEYYYNSPLEVPASELLTKIELLLK